MARAAPALVGTSCDSRADHPSGDPTPDRVPPGTTATPGASSSDVESWLAEAGFEDVTLDLSGAIGYFRGRKG